MYNFEKIKIDIPQNRSETEKELSRIREEIKNIQTAIEENDRIKDKIALSLAKNENNKKILKGTLLKLISKNDKNGSFVEAYKTVKKEKEELEKKNHSYKNYLHTVIKDKEIKDNKLGEVLSEVDYLKKLIEEKDKKLKEISIKNSSQSNSDIVIHSKSQGK